MTLQVANSAIMPQPPTQFATLTDVISYEGDFNRAVQSELATILRAINANIYTPGGNLATLDALASVANLTTLANQSAAAKVWTDVNDGSGSGLDADTLDGHDTGYFQQALGYTPVNKAGDAMSGGLSFGSTAVVSPTDVTRHIALWGAQFGFSISNNSQNYVVNSTSAHHFYVGASNSLTVDNGLIVGAPTGGDPGAGKVNAVDYEINGTALSAIFASLDGATFTGPVTFGSNSTSFNGSGSGNVGIELGGHGYSNLAFIDFHTGATDVDYDVRLIASGGSGVAGGGTLTFTGAHLEWSTAPTLGSDLANKDYVDGALAELGGGPVFGFAPTIGGSASNFVGPGGSSATESNVRGVFPAAGTASSLFVKTGVNIGGGSVTVKLRINGVDTALAIPTFSSGSTGSDTTHSVTIAAGDLWSIHETTASLTTSHSSTYGFQFTPA